jgi:hypothetical protein
MKLEQLAPGQSLSGVEPPNVVSVVASVPLAADSVQLIYRTSDGTMKERLLGRADEARHIVAPLISRTVTSVPLACHNCHRGTCRTASAWRSPVGGS